MIGRDKNITYWRVLKIDKLDSSELNIREDSTVYWRENVMSSTSCIFAVPFGMELLWLLFW